MDLDLSSIEEHAPKLSELPESLGELTHLRSLNLYGNRLTTLPESLGNLTQLQSLNLYGNRLTTLPDSLGNLTQLQSLYLINNQLTTLPESFGLLTELQSLYLSNNKLTTLPESFGQISLLRSLQLSNNDLVTLPETLGNLTKLQSLDISNNQLMVLPESLKNLISLQVLNLKANRLKTLPNCLDQLPQIQSLFLSENRLEILPESLGQLTRLQSLDISNNQLTALPESLGQLTQLQSLNISNNQLMVLPEWLGQFTQLQSLAFSNNQLMVLPEWLGQFTQLQSLAFSNNQLTVLPEWLGQLTQLRSLDISKNRLKRLPDSSGNLIKLKELSLGDNQLTDIPSSMIRIEKFDDVVYENYGIKNNPFNPELAEAYKQGLYAVKAYLRAKADAIILNEAKLILIGEGEVGKSCLLGALRDDDWEEGRPTTHGIEIKSVQATDPDSGKEITLNGWDFGGQRVYRPTHQLFFSSPAVYLVVWKPREGPQQGFVKEWIQLVKRREPQAKILVVATHGGPGLRQPDIDRQELWDLFGQDTVLDFFFVESKPDATGARRGIAELKTAIARVAAALPEVGRSVPKSFQETWQALRDTGAAYLPLAQVLEICRAHHMDDEIARLFVTISHRLGHLIHYAHDPVLRDIVVLEPVWLVTAISFVLDDAATRAAHGLVRFSRLSQLWDDPARPADSRYPAPLHPIFLQLMERFDLSYRVADPAIDGRGDPLGRPYNPDPLSLIGQLVPDNRPETDLARAWPPAPAPGDLQQVQICRIVDAQNGQSANAEGLFYQLIVRLHKYSLGRVSDLASVHWQRGLVLDDDYNGRALLEYVGNDVRITVRAPYPQSLLTMLTAEVKYLVESFWEGLRCNVMVPCIAPCGRNAPGTGMFEVRELIESKRRGRQKHPCPVCNEWQDIDCLLTNTPAAAHPISLEDLQAEFAAIKDTLTEVNATTKSILSRVDKTYTDLLQVLTDEAKEGPRLFSLRPVDPGFLGKPKWVSQKFHLVLWCEHSRLPLFILDNNLKSGVYDLDLPREWVLKAAPFLKALTVTLGLVLPVAASAAKLAIAPALYDQMENNLKFGEDCFDAVLKSGEKVGAWLGQDDSLDLPHGPVTRAEGATLRELQTYLKAKDPGYGGLVRVLNKRNEFLWVHPRYEQEY